MSTDSCIVTSVVTLAIRRYCNILSTKAGSDFIMDFSKYAVGKENGLALEGKVFFLSTQPRFLLSRECQCRELLVKGWLALFLLKAMTPFEM
jgi:hypothetical protein